MKKLLCYFLALFSLSILSSCSPAMLLLAGMKNPYFETKESLKNYAKVNKIDSLSILTSKDSASALTNFSLSGSHANIMVFNKDGYLVKYVADESCPGPVENYLRGICAGQPVSIDSTVSLNSFYSTLIPLYESQKIPDLKNNDLTIFLFWAVYINKRNRNTSEWRDVLYNEAGSCNYKIFMVNADLRAEYYGLSKRSKIKQEGRPKRK